MSLTETIFVLILSAAPISELRGGLPLALALDAPPVLAYLISVAGNLLPVPALLFGLGWLLPRLTCLPAPVGPWVARYLAWQEARLGRHVARLGYVALFFLVAIPLPMTGAWTGCLAATLLGLRPRRAALPIVIGVLVAGVLVLLAALGILHIFSPRGSEL